MPLSPRKLLVFIHHLEAGGAERVAAELANHWADKGWQVSLVTLASGENDFYRLHPLIRRVCLNLASESRWVITALRNNMRRVRALRRVLAEVQPDVALAFTTTANLLLALAASGKGKICAIGTEHVHPPRQGLSWFWLRLRPHLYGRLRVVATPTHEIKTWLLQYTNAGRVDVIPNPVPWPLPRLTPAVSPSELLESTRRVLLAVGRLDEQKGFDLLIRAFEPLAKTHPTWDLVILGDGRLRAQLLEQIVGAGLEHRVKLIGQVGNIGDWYEVADLYVLSSRFEGFGNTLAEAMASGVPAVSFDCIAGPREIIRNGVDGLLVPSEDVAALTSALDLLMEREDMRAEYGMRATEVRKRFSMVRIAKLWEELFEDVSPS